MLFNKKSGYFYKCVCVMLCEVRECGPENAENYFAVVVLLYYVCF